MQENQWEKQAIGVKVTLLRIYDFYDKLVNIDLPRIRDFRGVNKNSFDSRGNFDIGVKEQIIYPEINYDNVTRNHWYGYFNCNKWKNR